MRPAFPPRFSWRRGVFVISLALAAIVTTLGTARADEAKTGARQVDLYTVGQGSYLYSTYGHSILCVREASAKPADGQGRCYDYGVAAREDVLWILWSSLRARSIFTPVTIDDRSLVAFFEGQGRAIERQTLPLAPEEAERLATRLEQDVATGWSYAYDSLRANCATQLRDRIDEATNGRLRPGPAEPVTTTYRAQLEAGLTGRMFELAVLALILGPTADHVPDGWEAMYLPSGLRDGVTARFGVQPEMLAERQAVLLPTSAAAGRLLLFVIAFALFLGVRLAARKGRLVTAARVVGVVLALFALFVDVTALVSTWPEFSRNWALVVLLPTDLALGWLRGTTLRSYLRARLVMVLGVFVLELVSVVSQPMMVSVVLVALPFSGLLGALRTEAAARAAMSSAAGPSRAARTSDAPSKAA